MKRSYLILATGSVRPVISLPSLQPRSPPTFLIWLSQLALGTVSYPSLVDEVEEEMAAPYSMLQSTFSEAGVGQEGQPSDPSTPPDLHSYDHILSVILADLGKSELLVRYLPKPCSFWEFDQEVQVISGAGALNTDPGMVVELIKAFQEPTRMTKPTDAVSAYKVLAELHNHCLRLLK